MKIDAVFVYFNYINQVITGAEHQLDCAYVRTYLKNEGFHTVQYVNKNVTTIVNVVEELLAYEDVPYVFYINEYNFYISKSVINLVREKAPRCKIICFGGGLSNIYETIIHILNINIYIVQDIHIAMLDIIKNEKELSEIPNLIYGDNREIKTTELVDFEYSLDDIGLPYSSGCIPVEEVQNVGMITSLGCYGQCCFCSYIRKNSSIKLHSINSVIEELKYIKKKIYGRSIRISFLDDCFSVNKDRIQELCQRITDEDILFEFWCCTRADILNYETLEYMKKANMKGFTIGLETASPRIMNCIGKIIKKETAEQYINNVMDMYQYADKIGLSPFVSIMFGLPKETYDDAVTTYNFLKSNNVKQVSICYMTVFTESGIFRDKQDLEINYKYGPTILPLRTFYDKFNIVRIYERMNDYVEIDLKRYIKHCVLGERVTGISKSSIQYIFSNSISQDSLSFIKNNIDMNGCVIQNVESLTLTSSHTYSDDRKTLKYSIDEYDKLLEDAFGNNCYIPNQLYVKENAGKRIITDNSVHKKMNPLVINQLITRDDFSKFLDAVEFFKTNSIILLSELRKGVIENSCRYNGACSICNINRVWINGSNIEVCNSNGIIGTVKESYSDLQANINKIRKEKEISCSNCSILDKCSKCSFLPSYLSEGDYCKIMKGWKELSNYINILNHLLLNYSVEQLSSGSSSNIIVSLLEGNEFTSFDKSLVSKFDKENNIIYISSTQDDLEHM